MRPYSTWEDQDVWDEDSISNETHIDTLDNHDAAWINNAKDRTQSIIANLETSEPAQLSEFYDPETFKSRFGQDPLPATEATPTPKSRLHIHPPITEGLATLSHICSCCQLPLAPDALSAAPSSPLLRTATDPCCACYCPDIKMPREVMEPLPSQKPHIRRKSSLSLEEDMGWHRKHHGEIECAERENKARNEMSIGAWL